MRRGNRVWSYVLAGVIVAGLGACGGGGPTGGTPPPPPPPPTPVIVAQGQGFPLKVDFVSFANFTTPQVGTVEATVDWTFAANDLDVYLTPGSCTFDQLIANRCSMLTFSESTTAKPERVRATNVAAGSYIIWVANAGPGDESLSYQVVFTANATGSVAPGVAASDSASLRPSLEKGRLRGASPLR